MPALKGGSDLIQGTGPPDSEGLPAAPFSRSHAQGKVHDSSITPSSPSDLVCFHLVLELKSTDCYASAVI